MARFAIASGFACSLSWWLRLIEEGHEVRVWVAPESEKSVGDGLVPKVGTWPDLLAWARASRGPTVVVFDASGMGEKADDARRAGLAVLGGGAFCDKLEKNRSFGVDLARAAGANVPEFEEFSGIDEIIAHAQKGNVGGAAFFKTDRYLDSDTTHKADDADDLVEYLTEVRKRHGSRGRSILQEHIEGIAISTARWWDGQTWCSPYEGTIEHKKFLAGDIGPATGCAFNAAWWYESDTPTIAASLNFEALTALFIREQAPPGIYDMNSVVDDRGRAWFLEWTPRFGYDSEMTMGRLIPDLGQFLWTVATGRGTPDFLSGIAYSVRLSVPPYPWEHSVLSDKRTAVGTRVRGDITDAFVPYQLRAGELGLEVASPEAIVGLVSAAGADLSVLHEDCMAAAKGLKVSGLQYRNDGEEMIMDDAQALVDSGVDDMPPGLLD